MRGALLFLVIFALPLRGQAQRGEPVVATFPSRAFVLDNGLRVYLEHDSSLPTVSVAMAYSAGNREDPVDRPGLAHLTEHVTYQGTRDLGEDEMIAMLERVGVLEWNGLTADEDTTYYATAPREAVSSLLWIEAQRMAFTLTHADEATVAHQVHVVQREWQERIGDHAGSALGSVLRAALFPAGHPYARASPTPAQTAALTLRDVQWFHQQFYRPSRARLAVIGDVPLDEAERLVRSLFSGIVDRGVRVARSAPTLERSLVDRTIILRAPVPTPTMQIAWVTPPYFERLDAELDVLSSLLCDNESAVLASEIVRARGVGARVDCGQASDALASVFAISIAVGDQRDPSAIPRAVDDVLAQVATQEIDAETIERARRKDIERVASYGRDPAVRARVTAGFTLSPNAGIERYSLAADVARYRAVSVASLAETARYLMSTGRVIVLTIPDPSAPDEGTVTEDLRHPL